MCWATRTGRRRCAGVASSMARGVRVVLDGVVTGAAFTVLEARFVNPTDDPGHCPPALTQVLFHPRGRTERVLFAYAERPAAPPRDGAP